MSVSNIENSRETRYLCATLVPQLRTIAKTHGMRKAFCAKAHINNRTLAKVAKDGYSYAYVIAAIEQALRGDEKGVTPEDVIKAAKEKFDNTPGLVEPRDKEKRLRQFCARVMFERMRMSLPETAMALGYNAKSSVNEAVRTICDLMEGDHALRRAYFDVVGRLFC